MQWKPIASIAEELNNVLTVVAMCTDELESGPRSDALADIRDALRRGAALTKLLVRREDPVDSSPLVSDVVATPRTTILVADAEETVRRAVTHGVEGRGWQVLEASSIVDAMQALEGVRAIDVVVVDTSIGGRRLAAKLVERYPSVAVVFTGGFVDDAPLRSELPRSDVSLLCRPFTTTALVERIDQAVARRR